MHRASGCINNSVLLHRDRFFFSFSLFFCNWSEREMNTAQICLSEHFHIKAANRAASCFFLFLGLRFSFVLSFFTLLWSSITYTLPSYCHRDIHSSEYLILLHFDCGVSNQMADLCLCVCVCVLSQRFIPHTANPKTLWWWFVLVFLQNVGF